MKFSRTLTRSDASTFIELFGNSRKLDLSCPSLQLGACHVPAAQREQELREYSYPRRIAESLTLLLVIATCPTICKRSDSVSQYSPAHPLAFINQLPGDQIQIMVSKHINIPIDSMIDN